MPVETPGAQQAQNHVIFLENFFDELRRKAPGREIAPTPLIAELPRKQVIRNVLPG